MKILLALVVMFVFSAQRSGAEQPQYVIGAENGNLIIKLSFTKEQSLYWSNSYLIGKLIVIVKGRVYEYASKSYLNSSMLGDKVENLANKKQYKIKEKINNFQALPHTKKIDGELVVMAPSGRKINYWIANKDAKFVLFLKKRKGAMVRVEMTRNTQP